ncbi:DUF2487 family protein [Paenibacillus sp. Marseille-P2973]|uniref:DUF2487 family protein n=1 Tax=Paenibacillus TaxID=44249 RepID=UPI001B379780|nr:MULTISPECIES: DUF2487 family protein [Paenibacillus]MBQ4898449.1 DUF2487 family protein [Paenibacillus sp. Marseille-P2973]MDN4071137.1 DUF2487 family protein [Paenibacillus vini]
MKFSEVEPETWEELSPYLDTCLIPVTGLTGEEKPYEVTGALERLRDIMDWVELPFQGRVVTYPSFQYGREEIAEQINSVCRKVKSSGFAFAIVISENVEFTSDVLPDADLIITPGRYSPNDNRAATLEVKGQIQQMWQTGRK